MYETSKKHGALYSMAEVGTAVVLGLFVKFGIHFKVMSFFNVFRLVRWVRLRKYSTASGKAVVMMK